MSIHDGPETEGLDETEPQSLRDRKLDILLENLDARVDALEARLEAEDDYRRLMVERGDA